MTDRLHFGKDYLAISKPGVDVNSASIKDMLFDSRYGKYFGIYMTGTVDMNSFAQISQSKSNFLTTTTYRAIVGYGTTFPRTPLVLAAYLDPDHSNCANAWYAHSRVGLTGNSSGQHGTGGGCSVFCKPQADRVFFDLVQYHYDYDDTKPSGIAFAVAQIGF